MSSAHRGQEKASGPLELELWITIEWPDPSPLQEQQVLMTTEPLSSPAKNAFQKRVIWKSQST